MKTNLYKLLFAFIAILFVNTSSAQKYHKKFTEKFSVNKDVEVDINAENTTIEVQTWNKNQVAVEAFIEVEGLSEKEAEKYFKDWDFEALGNKLKVKIISKRQNTYGSNNDFVIFNNQNYDTNFEISDFVMSDVVIPDFDSIDFPSFPEMEVFVLPEMDFDPIHFGLEDLEFDFDKYAENGEKYFFQWKDSANNITIKSKEEWQKFKESKEYKKMKKELEEKKKEMKKELKKVQIKFKSLNKKNLKKSLEKAKKEYEKIDRKEIKNALVKAHIALSKTKGHYLFNAHSDNLTVNGKKIKIQKRFVIKVPKATSFHLNTKHCKVSLPKVKATGKVSYGTFNADELNEGDLTISFATVNVKALYKNTLSLNNVTEANFTSVKSAKITSNSSGLKIKKIHENVVITHKFGELTIDEINPNFKTFKLLLNYSDATIDFTGVKERMSYNIEKKSSLFSSKATKTFSLSDLKKKGIDGDFSIKTANNNFVITGKYSQLKVKQ